MAQARRRIRSGKDSHRRDRLRLLRALIVICRRIARLQTTTTARQACHDIELRLQEIVTVESRADRREESH